MRAPKRTPKLPDRRTSITVGELRTLLTFSTVISDDDPQPAPELLPADTRVIDQRDGRTVEGGLAAQLAALEGRDDSEVIKAYGGPSPRQAFVGDQLVVIV